MRQDVRKSYVPVDAPRTTRNHDIRVLSSFKAGKMVPVAAVPILREDSLTGRYQVTLEMQETAEIIMNAVNVDFFAYVVPWLAFPRFQGSMDILNRSWEGVAAYDGGPVVPYFATQLLSSTSQLNARFGPDTILRSMGLHGRVGSTINEAYAEAYNLVWNHRAANRSPDIAPRPLLNSGAASYGLAPAFWKHQAMRHIVPDFDDAAMEGQVPLTIVNGQLQVTSDDPVYINGLYRSGSAGAATGISGDNNGQSISDGVQLRFRQSGGGTFNELPYVDFSSVYAELEGDGITVSLANIELARKTQAFAALRKQYEGHTQEWLIAMMMDGLTIPDQHLKDPILVGHQSTIVGFSKRYATDSGALDQSATNGMSQLMLDVNVPRLATGGILMLFVEVTPDQLWERKQDPLLNMSTTTDDWPHYLRDALDPQKVEVVQNQYVDMDHDSPTGLFGYAPLAHKWNVTSPRVGGKFYRPEVDADFDEDRQRIWAAETQNPSLSTDFYVATQMHQKPFLDTESDGFEIIVQGATRIDGHTVFGPMLIEASDSYDKVMAEAPIDRIEK